MHVQSEIQNAQILTTSHVRAAPTKLGRREQEKEV